LRLRGEAGEVWQEEVLAVRTTSQFIDAFFLPPDRRTTQANQPADEFLPLAIDVPPCVERRFPLSEAEHWREVLDQGREHLRVALEELGAEGAGIEPAYYFELDEEARPVTLMLRLAAGELAPDQPPPAGWKRQEARPALSLFVRSLGQVNSARLTRLRAEPSVAQPPPHPAYLRLEAGEGASELAQLVQPL
jgi:hypothetical protein